MNDVHVDEPSRPFYHGHAGLDKGEPAGPEVWIRVEANRNEENELMNRLSKGNVRRMSRVATTVVAVFFASAGCGGEQQPEDIGGSANALGSTKPQVTISDWDGLTRMVSDGNYLLGNNLDASGKTWTPKTFSGTFDGNNKTISNLTINFSGGFNSGFFSTMLDAIVRRVRFVNLTVTGNGVFFMGGLAGWASNSLIEDVGVEANITATGAISGGGLLGEMYGGSINRSWAKGSVNSPTSNAGGLVGAIYSSDSHPTIWQSYALVTVSPNTSNSAVYAGGLVGRSFAADLREVYAVGNVTGRGNVGGLVGSLECDEYNSFVLNHGIYRGNVTDVNRPPPGGWAGTVGTVQDCVGRFDQLVWDSSLDTSTNFYVSPTTDPRYPVQKGGSSATLRQPTTAAGGIYATDDNSWQSAVWDAGTSGQHHALRGLPGGLSSQPR